MYGAMICTGLHQEYTILIIGSRKMDAPTSEADLGWFGGCGLTPYITTLKHNMPQNARNPISMTSILNIFQQRISLELPTGNCLWRSISQTHLDSNILYLSQHLEF